SCSRPSSLTASSPGRPSPWATPRISATTWRAGRSGNGICWCTFFFLKEKESKRTFLAKLRFAQGAVWSNRINHDTISPRTYPRGYCIRRSFTHGKKLKLSALRRGDGPRLYREYPAGQNQLSLRRLAQHSGRSHAGGGLVLQRLRPSRIFL